MKRAVALLAVAGGLALSGTAAAHGGVGFSVSIGAPIYAPPPVYYAPPPRVYYGPPTLYYGPAYYGYGGPRHWRRHHWRGDGYPDR